MILVLVVITVINVPTLIYKGKNKSVLFNTFQLLIIAFYQLSIYRIKTCNTKYLLLLTP